jgi:Spy/CpxP family protein refolding chaperone
VRNRLLVVSVAVCLFSVFGFRRTIAQQAVPASTANAGAPSVDDVLKTVRSDLQSSRTDVISKNVTLTAEQAAKFWPVFEAYQKEQNAIIDEQMKAMQTFAEGAQTLDDAGALALINAHFTRDAKMNALRQKWLPEFQKVLPTKLAVRVMQIDRRLSLVQQWELTSRIPLAQ